jgi:hypothetical protein
MREEPHMSYKKVKSVKMRHNVLPSKLEREYAPARLINTLYQDKIVINVDESILDETDFRHKDWSKVVVESKTSLSQRLEKVSIIGGVSNRGDLYYSINLGNNNKERFWYFLLKLCFCLNQRDRNWRLKTVISLDNAPYHRSRWIIGKYEAYRLPIMFLGPYQFSMAPMEMVFAYIKQHDLNYMSTAITTK